MTEYKVKVDDSGTIRWYNLEGEHHRENDLPAVEYADGSKYWFHNGKRHREDGPAIEYTSGNKYWYLNGKRHREDGPAIEYTNGNKYWYLNGKRHREDEFLAKTQKHVILIDGKELEIFLSPTKKSKE